MSATLVYRSAWSRVKPLVYVDNFDNESVTRFVHKVFSTKSKRLVIQNNKYMYHPSDEYKEFVVRLKKIK